MLTLSLIPDPTSLKFTEFIHQHYVLQCLISVNLKTHFYHVLQINLYDAMKKYKVQITDRLNLGNLQTPMKILRIF